MRLRDQSHNRSSRRGQKEECPTCRDFLCFDTDGMGRCVAWCPHCRDGRPHSRAQHLARLAEEDRACREPEQSRCAWCDTPFPVEASGQQYCGPSCREAAGNHRANARNRRRREAREAGTPVPKRIATVQRPTQCKHCGAPLVQRDVGQPRQYCDRQCRNAGLRGRRPESPYLAALRRRWQRKTSTQEMRA